MCAKSRSLTMRPLLALNNTNAVRAALVTGLAGRMSRRAQPWRRRHSGAPQPIHLHNHKYHATRT
eukprot:1356749-Pyramimonas_sp.AAC.1